MFPSSVSALDGVYSVGFRMQGQYDFEPGNDFYPGLEIGYSDYGLFEHKLQFKFGYLTSRLEEAMGRYILREDVFLFSPAWHFRREKLFDPYMQMDLGYMRFDVENEAIFGDLDNDSYVASLLFGLNVNLKQGKYGLFYDFGYSFLTSSRVNPGVFSIGFWVNH